MLICFALTSNLRYNKRIKRQNMRYLSIDIEATGLNENCHIIEFAMVPFDSKTKIIELDLAMGFYIKCPSFEELKPKLDTWIIENMQQLIKTAHQSGKSINEFKQTLDQYLDSDEIKNYFAGQDKIVLFGKSMNAIDLPFLNRDLGWDWMRKRFHFRVHDLSSYTFGLMDMGLLPKGSDSGSALMNYLGMGEVAHTALEDAINTAEMYLKLLTKFENITVSE